MNVKPIRVLLFANSTVRAGVEEHMIQLLNGFDRRLITPHLACTSQLAELIKPDLRPDVDVFPMTIDGLTDFAGVTKLAGILRKRQIQVLHSHMFRASLFASPIGRLCRVPVVLETSHGRELWRKGWIKSRFFIDRFAARFVDYVIAVSGATARYLIEHKGLPANKVVVIRGAANLKPFDPSRPSPEGLKRSLGFAENDPVLLVLARLEPQKGHRVLLEAMPLILQQHPNARLVCLGDGALRRELEDFVTRNGLASNVRFVGRQSDVGKWLAFTDLTVLPSFWEGLPLAVIESLAAGRPVVATAVDGTTEVVLDGKTGLTAPAGDRGRLAEAVNRTLRDPIRAREMAQAGRELVLREFDVEKLIQTTQNLYLRALEERLPGRGQQENRAAVESTPGKMGPGDLPSQEAGLAALTGEGKAEEPEVQAFVTKGAEVPDASKSDRPVSNTLSASTEARPNLVELGAITEEETVRLCLEKCGQELRAIVLTGSVARGEATFVEENPCWRLLGDVDFFLVYEQTSRLPSDAALASLVSAIEERLLARGIYGQIGLGVVYPSYLRRSKAHIATYELRTCGRVLWGDAGILSLIPSFGVGEICREDAWRMLCNRAVEFLGHAAEAPLAENEINSSVFYAAIKLMLDAATSYLVFEGAYEPTFRGRAVRLSELARESAAISVAPFPLKQFADQVSTCTAWKLSGSKKSCDLRPALWKQAVRYACALWRWELVQLTGAPPSLSDDALWSRWVTQRTALQTARGWLSLAHRRGWHRSWRNWPRWMRLSRRGTPRYAIYRVAAGLLSGLSGSTEIDGARLCLDPNWGELRALLPERGPASVAREESWQQLAADVAWNYKSFLLGTDA